MSRSSWCVYSRRNRRPGAHPLALDQRDSQCGLHSRARSLTARPASRAGQRRQARRRLGVRTRRLCLGLQRALPGESPSLLCSALAFGNAPFADDSGDCSTARHRPPLQPPDAPAPRTPAVPWRGAHCHRSCAGRARHARDVAQQRHDEPHAAQADAACVQSRYFSCPRPLLRRALTAQVNVTTRAVSPSLPTPSFKDAKLPRGTVVEEAIVAGDGGSGVYWRVVNP